MHSNAASRNDIFESQAKASVTFGDEPDLTSHRWSASLNSPTPAQSVNGKSCAEYVIIGSTRPYGVSQLYKRGLQNLLIEKYNFTQE